MGFNLPFGQKTNFISNANLPGSKKKLQTMNTIINLVKKSIYRQGVWMVVRAFASKKRVHLHLVI